jgi:flagellin FlaB
MSKFVRNEDAFTGLEAAIVLIAFVVVAAVFSYVVLGAGFFTTQKSQEVVHTGVAQTSSSIEIVGDVIGKSDGSKITSILVTVALSAGGGSVDFDKVVVTYSDAGHVETLTKTAVINDKLDAGAGEWHIYEQKNQNTGELLESLEQFTLTVGIPTDATVDANHPFTVEIKPAVGAPCIVERTAPPQFTTVNILR